MDVFKLRLKIGANEFEAEGSQEYVESERDIFLETIGSAKQDEDDPGAAGADELGRVPPGGVNGDQPPATTIDFPRADMQKLARQEKDAITLTALPSAEETKEEDAFVLLLLAHKVMRGVDNVPSDDLMEGMNHSGVPVGRLDTLAKNKKLKGLVLKTGRKRGTTYRLANTGITKAKEIATGLLTHVG
jgi:hypothetical protein